MAVPLHHRAGQQLTLDLCLQLYEKLARQSAAYFEGQPTGDLLARVTADVDGIQVQGVLRARGGRYAALERAHTPGVTAAEDPAA